MAWLSVFISHITLKDVCDVFMVSILIYQLLLIIKGTRAVQVLIGLFFLFGLYWVGLNFKLYSLNWLLEHFFDYFIVILVVLFQDQLRDALANIGVGRSFYQKSPREYEQMIEEIVEAYKLFKKQKIGALVVIERNNGLLNYIRSGSLMDSEIHLDLLYAIFQSKSPLHDGAIIISNNKIAAAGCFLPLSKSLDIDRKFGTRHRAALGISEVSDAIAISASEETGAINIFVGGEKIPCDNSNELRHLLRQLHFQEGFRTGLGAEDGAA